MSQKTELPNIGDPPKTWKKYIVENCHMFGKDFVCIKCGEKLSENLGECIKYEPKN